MNILFLVDPTPDSGVDYLYHGLRMLQGDGAISCVLDWPIKPSLHLSDATKRDRPGGQSWPLVDAHPEDRMWDLVVLARSSGVVVDVWKKEIAHLPAVKHSRIIAVDMEDDTRNRREIYQKLLPRLDHYFKRELRIGEMWATPLPMCATMAHFSPAVLGRTHTIHWRCRSSTNPRRHEVFSLLRALQTPTSVVANADKEWLKPQQYTEELALSEIGVVDRGAGQDTLRYWEIPAAGALLIARRTENQVPEPFTHGDNAFFYSSTNELGEILRELRMLPAERLMELRVSCQDHWAAHHTTAARAQYFLEKIG